MKDGYYTFDDIATMTGLSINGVYTRFNKLDVDKSKIKTVRIGNGTVYLFTMEQIKELGLLQEKKIVPKKIVPKKSDVDLEELKKLHPLVRDNRFFKTSYFPDIVPDCYK